MTAPASRHLIDLLNYQVQVGPWLLDDVGGVAVRTAAAHVYAVITDENVGPVAAPQVVGSLTHFAPRSRVIVRVIPAGEPEKTRDTWARLTDWLLEARCGRDTTIVALGGGVVGDLAGFVAATFMRGVPYVQVPTSLLAMVDASVGGKVGVDTTHGKNLVGAFHQPSAVVVDPTVLQTLPTTHLRAGFAELVKHGVIAGEEYLTQTVRVGRQLLHAPAGLASWHSPDLTDLVAGSVRIKAGVVERDERERGVRQVLNYGHTVGHAVELVSGFSMLHGEAIAIGMCVESRLAQAAGVAPAGLQERVHDALIELGLPTRVPAHMSPADLLGAMRLDKKARAGRLVFALPVRVGEMANPESGIPLDERLVEQVLAQG